VLVGILTHILADMLNPEGVELFYPIKKNYRILKLRFNSTLGNGLVIAISLALIFLRLTGYGVSVKPLITLAYSIHSAAMKP